MNRPRRKPRDNGHPQAGERGAPPIATGILLLAQVAVWVVVRRYLVNGNGWTDFALRPGTPSEWGFVISPFVHLEPAHLGVNLAVLWLVGANLERVLGHLRFLALYLGAAWFASLMQWAVFTSFHLETDLSFQTGAVGASGAIAGLLGAAIVRFPSARLRLPFTRRRTFPVTPVLVLWLTYTLVRAALTTVNGAAEGIADWAHLAGFIFGLGVAQLRGMQSAARREYIRRAARRALSEGDFHAAAAAWSALVTLSPLDMEARTALVETRLELDDPAAARRSAAEAIEAFARAGERAPAIEAYRELVARVPELELPPGVRFRVGCWLADAGDDELAYRALCESATEEGASPVAAGALFRAGQVAWERLRKAGAAREAWARVIEQFPDSPWRDAAREALRRLPASP